MAKAKTAEPQKKTGDALESLIDRTGAGSDERPDPETSDDENTFERDPEDEDPEGDDSTDE
jgi:hypothetical protein